MYISVYDFANIKIYKLTPKHKQKKSEEK